ARPHLGAQADGGRRFAYNPRVLDLVRRVPRGTIYDRRGAALAQPCAEPGERCYPLGGKAFHLIGDARTRLNWSAPNTSYVERDAEDRLRGFDDHATTVETKAAAGRPMLTVRRDYTGMVPAL